MNRWLRWGGTLGLNLVVWAFVAFALVPFVQIGSMSVETPVELLSNTFHWVQHPTLANYRDIFSASSAAGAVGQVSSFLRYFLNSLLVSTASVLIALIVGIPAAAGLAHLVPSLRNNLMFTYLSFYFAPALAIVVPLYTIFSHIGLTNTYTGLIWSYQIVVLPFMVVMLTGYFEQLPKETEEAASIDGAGQWTLFWRIRIPLMSGGIVASAIIGFMYAWNNLLLPLVLGNQGTQPVTVGILSFISYNQASWGPMAAATMVSALPEVLLTLAVQRYLVRGLTLGATSELV
ncbi:MAG: carbohydrate ABC transporter permease [Alicyclobacillus sp.]|nr:carbohydrate ABC transporter permease [Alicyclobacillus sp.]